MKNIFARMERNCRVTSEKALFLENRALRVKLADAEQAERDKKRMIENLSARVSYLETIQNLRPSGSEETRQLEIKHLNDQIEQQREHTHFPDGATTEPAMSDTPHNSITERNAELELEVAFLSQKDNAGMQTESNCKPTQSHLFDWSRLLQI
jgi:predicted RNase H-like nuclease (RuvC/YqgF family)